MDVCRESASISWIGTPLIVICPFVGSAMRASSFTNVVFPEPVSPTTATFVPAGIRMLMSSRTWLPSDI